MQGKFKWLLAAWLFCGTSLTAQAALDASLQRVQQAQVQLLRAGTDLFMHRGEGGHAELAAKAEADLALLNENLKTLEAWPLQSAVREMLGNLKPRLKAFEDRVHKTLAFNPGEPDLPWEFNFEYSKAQRELVQSLEALDSELLKGLSQPLTASQTRLLDLPAKVQYLAMRYTARAYIGDIETLPDQQQHYLNQDIDALAKSVDADLKALGRELTGAEQQKKLKQAQLRWHFIYGRLLNYSEDMAPLMVERHAADVADQLLALQGLE